MWYYEVDRRYLAVLWFGFAGRVEGVGSDREGRDAIVGPTLGAPETVQGAREIARHLEDDSRVFLTFRLQKCIYMAVYETFVCYVYETSGPTSYMPGCTNGPPSLSFRVSSVHPWPNPTASSGCYRSIPPHGGFRLCWRIDSSAMSLACICCRILPPFKFALPLDSTAMNISYVL
ncbi:hypothetical protein B0H13DRAFT_802379 [Mycena leptocephala]|nr:hypothetical protein B0H13DRAFT_802379 [Mycena leptocephala]